MRVFLFFRALFSALRPNYGHPKYNTRKLTLFWKRQRQMRVWNTRWRVMNKTFKHIFIMMSYIEGIPCSPRNQPDGKNNGSKQTRMQWPPLISPRVAAQLGFYCNSFLGHTWETDCIYFVLNLTCVIKNVNCLQRYIWTWKVCTPLLFSIISVFWF